MSENTATVDLTRVENLLGDLVKSLNEQQPVVDNNAELIAKGADALVAEAKSANEAIIKSLDALHASLNALNDRLSAIETKASAVESKVEKSIATIEAQPVAPRSVQSVEAPVAAVPSITKQQIIEKALVELPTAEGDRKMQLLSAIAKLDTNYAPAEIAAELNLR